MARRVLRPSHLVLALGAAYLLLVSLKFRRVLDLATADLAAADFSSPSSTDHLPPGTTSSSSNSTSSTTTFSVQPFWHRYDRVSLPDPTSRTHALTSALDRMADDAWSLGLAAWDEAAAFAGDPWELLASATARASDASRCPSAVAQRARGRVVFLPCGLAAGSSVTVHIRLKPAISFLIFVTVDGFPKCEKWIRNDIVDTKESKTTSWLKRFIGRAKKPAMTWPFPFVEERLFVLTIQAGVEGFHIYVGGRHVTSFPYRPNSRKEVNVMLKKEAEYFGDIVILPFIDRYELVVLKTIAICEYGVQNLTAANIMKCDDDTFVRVNVVLRHIKLNNGGKPLYMGNLNLLHRPLRTGKWAVTDEEWPEDIYPPYANGPGYVISGDIAKFIVSQHANQSLRLFKMEDVSMGLWVEKFNSTTPVQYSHSWKFCQYGCLENYFTAHYQSPRQMLCLWDKLSRGRASCCNYR
nr:unnamed protein product [Digitaria exilis]